MINSCRVDRDKKFICCLLIAGHNAVAVVGGVLLDVSNGFFYRVDNLYAENEIEIFLPPFFRSGRGCGRQDCKSCTVSVKGNIFFGKALSHGRQKTLCDIFVHQHLFSSVTDGRSGSFRIEDDVQSHIDISSFIYINVAVAGAGFYYRHFCVIYDGTNQSSATSGNQHIQVFGQGHHFGSRLSGSIGNQLYAVDI